MQIALADAGPHRKQLTITYDKGEVEARRASVMVELGRQVRIDGFRPGKVSRGVLESRYGEAATAQAVDDLAREGLSKAIEEQRLKPVGQPELQPADRSSGGLRLVAVMEVRPDIAIPAAKDIRGVDVAATQVGAAQLDEAIQSMARRAGTMSVLAEGETVQADDSLTLSGTIAADGKELRKLHDFHHLVGGYPLFGKPPAEVIAAVAGKRVGDTIAFDTVLPASFTPAEAAGKPARLEAAIQNAERLRPVVVDDEFARKVGANDLGDLRERLRQRLAVAKDNEHRQAQLKALGEALLAQVPVEVPPLLLERATKAELERATAGKTGDEAAKAKADAEATTRRELQRTLIVEALADHLDIRVSNQDVHDQIQMAAHHTGRKPQAIADQLRSSGRVEQVVLEIRQAKALETYLDQVIAAQAPAAAAAKA